MINLWCDPSDSDCKNGRPSRPVPPPSPPQLRSIAPPPVPRQPMWLRHYNLSVVPPRCGDINIEPLFPFGDAFDDRFIFDYAQCTIEEFSSYVLERGECGKAGPALAFSTPASLPSPSFLVLASA